MTDQATRIDHAALESIVGGGPTTAPPPQQPEPKTWIDGLNESLKKRGFDPNIDPKGERKPPNPDVDPGILKPWDPFAAPREREA